VVRAVFQAVVPTIKASGPCYARVYSGIPTLRCGSRSPERAAMIWSARSTASRLLVGGDPHPPLSL